MIVRNIQEEEELTDYKFFCFNGEPKYCQVIEGRFGKQEFMSFYNMNWDLMPFNKLQKNGLPYENCIVPKPSNYEKMKAICKKLSKGIPFVRIDLYSISKSVYFSEITFFPASGNGDFFPEEYNRRIGDLVALPV